MSVQPLNQAPPPATQVQPPEKKRDWAPWASAGVALVAAIGALIYNAQSLDATRAQLQENQEQLQIAAQGQVNDRYTKAVDQLGSAGLDKLDVRLGAIFALERISRDSARDQPAVIDLLSSFVREHSGEPAT